MSAAPYWSLYRSAGEAIKEAAAAAAAPVLEGSSNYKDEATPSRPELEVHLERLVQETHPSSSRSVATQERPRVSKRARQDSGHQEEPVSIREAGDAAEAGEDECLGVLAEAFADDLDDLRKDEQFRGSARDVAAMADMMR